MFTWHRFSQNKYLRWYQSLMSRATCRVISQPYESHHVLPRSLGGDNGPQVNLTFREHFLAHWLLTKFTEGEELRKMNYAFACMGVAGRYHDRQITSRQYARSRVAAKAALSGRKISEKTRERMAEAARNRGDAYAEKMRQLKTGIRHTIETKAKLSAAIKSLPSETKQKMVEARKAKGGYSMSEFTKQKIRAANTGKVVSESTRDLLRARSTGNSWNSGKVRSDETKQRMSVAIKASWDRRKAAS